MRTVLGLPDLPTDLFLMVTRYLDLIDFVRCRLVSKPWHREFTDESLLRDVLIREYGETRDVRAALELEENHMFDRPFADDFSQSRDIWIKTFDRVLARRQALKSGKPRYVTKQDLRSGLTDFLSGLVNFSNYQVPISPWDRYHALAGYRRSAHGTLPEEQRVPTDLSETEWTYDSGLLVYPAMIEIQAYVLLDIERDTRLIVPFDINDRIVRRVRLKHGLLVFEWAEKKPYHKLNELEEVHRHYVTAFEIKRARDSFPWFSRWEISFRSEWKLHYLGFPLSALDSWMSDHSTTHYAVYIWQTNRSAWGENEPIESLLIWDISQPSSYRPSDSPSRGSQASVGPRLVKKLSYVDLEFLAIRQRDTPFLRKIALDGSACLYFFEEGSTHERGSHVGHGYEAGRRNHRDVVWERIVGIPVLGPGPSWEDRLGGDSTFTHDSQHTYTKSLDPLEPRRATCWRYRGMGPGIRNQILRDESAGIEYSVEQILDGFPEIWASSISQGWSSKIHLRDVQWRWKQIDGDERYLIIQSSQELHILHFDHDFGSQNRKRVSFLGAPRDPSTDR